MRSRSILLALLAALTLASTVGCKKLLSKATGKTSPCDLVTDAEMKGFLGQDVSHEGDDDSCKWTGADTTSFVDLQLMDSIAAKIVPTMGTPKDVPGIGDKATYYEGMAPQLRVETKGKVMMVTGVVLSAMGATKIIDGKSTKHATKGGTVTTTEETVENPALETVFTSVGRTAAGRM